MRKIMSKRDLAILLSDKGSVKRSAIGKNLNRIVEMWKRYGDIIIKDNLVIGNF